MVIYRPKDMVTSPHKQDRFQCPASCVSGSESQGSALRYSLLLMSKFTTRSDGWTSCSLYCLKPSSAPPAVALCLQCEVETVMINALSAWISGKEPGVPAEVLCPYCDDTVTQYLEFGATLKNNCIKTETYSAVCAMVEWFWWLVNC